MKEEKKHDSKKDLGISKNIKKGARVKASLNKKTEVSKNVVVPKVAKIRIFLKKEN